jgi:hypothetical protein
MRSVFLAFAVLSVPACGMSTTLPENDAGRPGHDTGFSDPCTPADAGAAGPQTTPCDPRVARCVSPLGCYYEEPVGGCAFECTPITGGGRSEGATCSDPTECDADLACVTGVPGCTGTSCCTPYCTVPSTCANGTACRPFGISGIVPPGLENLGVCAN